MPNSPLHPDEAIFSVSELNLAAKHCLEQQFGTLWVSGEISNLSIPRSGHMYFSLKDQKAQVRCAFFRGRQQRLSVRPSDGLQVLIKAQVSLYPDRGDYQLIVEALLPAGDGLLYQQFEALKKALAAAGLFAPERKKNLPRYPQTIGIITSASGAALQDMLSILKRRYPIAEIIVYDSQVQGEAATTQLCNAIQTANQEALCDLLVVTRGGGSIEDLWPFNESDVAYAIAKSNLPILSAVGHETDTTIADYVADQRAPTPSAAAELISPNQADIRQYLQQAQLRLTQSLQQCLQWQKQQLNTLAQRLQHPQQRLERQAQTWDRLSLQLQHLIEQKLNQNRQQYQRLRQRCFMQTPLPQIQIQQQRCQHLSQQLLQHGQERISNKREALALQAEKLDTLSPLSTLRRGYSIAQTHSGEIIRTAKQAKQEQCFTIQFIDDKIVIHTEQN